MRRGSCVKASSGASKRGSPARSHILRLCPTVPDWGTYRACTVGCLEKLCAEFDVAQP